MEVIDEKGNKWTPEEDAILKKFVKENGARSWFEASLCLPGRSKLSCSTRWIKFLSATVQHPFTPAEDAVIVKEHAQYENKWENIAKLLPGRTAYAIKSYWNTTLRRKQYSRVIMVDKTEDSNDNPVKSINFEDEKFGPHGPNMWLTLSPPGMQEAHREETGIKMIEEEKREKNLSPEATNNIEEASVQGVENLVIIGSGLAGCTAADYAARVNLKPVVFKGFQVGGVPGGQLMTATEVEENFPGFPEAITGSDLMDRMKQQAQRWGAEFYQEEVEFVDVRNRPFVVQSSERQVKCNSLIVATGATVERLNLPRLDEFWSRGISSCAICDGASPIYKGQVLAVTGEGDMATKEALYLTKYARHVHLVVPRDQLSASKAMQERVFDNPNITVHYNTETVNVVSNTIGQMSGILIRKLDTNEESVLLEAKGLFYGIGHMPNSKLLEGQISCDSSGNILVKEGTANTSVEGVFAAGDVQDRKWRQAITAAGAGCVAALSVERYLKSENLLVEFHQPHTEEVEKELTSRDVQETFDITLTKHKGVNAWKKLYHESPRLVCVLWTSRTCGPSKILKPILSKVIDKYDQNVHYVEIDITEDPGMAQKVGIAATPCVEFCKNKKHLRSMPGVKTEAEYREFIEANK